MLGQWKEVQTMEFLSRARAAELWTGVKAALETKQDRMTGRNDQLVGFDGSGNPAMRTMAVPGGIATLDSKGMLSPAQRPCIAEIKGGSNPNLLDNWYFADPINQKGQTEYASYGYSFDRWYIRTDGLTVLFKNQALQLLFTSNFGAFNQRIEHWECLLGKTVTVSALITGASFAEGNAGVRIGLVSANNVSSNSTRLTGQNYKNTSGLVTFTAELPNTIPHSGINFEIFSSNGASCGDYLEVAAVKLELGSHQTLAQQNAAGEWELIDPPPNKALEQLKCLQYQLVLPDTSAGNACVGIGTPFNSTSALIFIPTSVPMQKKPAVSFLPEVWVLSCLGSWDANSHTTLLVTNIRMGYYAQNGITVYCDTAGGLDTSRTYLLARRNTAAQASLLLDANL